MFYYIVTITVKLKYINVMGELAEGYQWESQPLCAKCPGIPDLVSLRPEECHNPYLRNSLLGVEWQHQNINLL